MKVTPSQYTNLIAASKGSIHDIKNMVLRKPANLIFQQKRLQPNSICITCNYIFRDQLFRWSDNIKAICHPFREPTVFPFDKKLFLFSESDFCDALISPVVQSSVCASYDFVYFTINSLQGIECKGLFLLDVIDKAAQMANLRGLVIDYGPPVQKKTKFTSKRTPEYLLTKARKGLLGLKNLTWKRDLLTNQEVCDVMKNCGFVLFPNTKDASPRLITESIIRGTPVLVNSNIYGGWKYVNQETGLLFDGPTIDVVYNPDWKTHNIKIIEHLAEKFLLMRQIDKSKVASSFYKSYGFVNSAKRLALIVNEVSGSRYDYVCYKEFTDAMETIVNNDA